MRSWQVFLKGGKECSGLTAFRGYRIVPRASGGCPVASIHSIAEKVNSRKSVYRYLNTRAKKGALTPLRAQINACACYKLVMALNKDVEGVYIWFAVLKTPIIPISILHRLLFGLDEPL